MARREKVKFAKIGIPDTAQIKDKAAKRVIDRLVEIIRNLEEAADKQVVSDFIRKIQPGDNIVVKQLSKGVLEISAEATTSAEEAGGGGGGLRYTGRKSVDVSGSTIQLVNDEDDPGVDTVYGVDAAGEKGWKADPPGGISLTGGNDGDVISWDNTTSAFVVSPMLTLANGDQQRYNATTKKWEKAVGPLNPGGAVDTIGSAAEGAEGADSTSKVFNNGKGLAFWDQTRQAYFDAGDQTWYAYARLKTYDRFGRFYSMSAETRIEIDATVPET